MDGGLRSTTTTWQLAVCEPFRIRFGAPLLTVFSLVVSDGITVMHYIQLPSMYGFRMASGEYLLCIEPHC